MDSTTKMEVNRILQQGYYREGQGLGEGGWSKIPTDWKAYLLVSLYEVIEQITAKDDETAVKAFKSLYHLDKYEWYEIVEKIVTYRTITED